MAAPSTGQRPDTLVPRACGLGQGPDAPDPAGRDARKLIVSLWRYVTVGLVPAGAVLKIYIELRLMELAGDSPGDRERGRAEAP